MTTRTLRTAVFACAAIAATGTAHARSDVQWSISIGGGPVAVVVGNSGGYPVYGGPGPVYGGSGPSYGGPGHVYGTVLPVYAPPPPVYAEPVYAPPVYAPVYAPPVYAPRIVVRPQRPLPARWDVDGDGVPNWRDRRDDRYQGRHEARPPHGWRDRWDGRGR